MSKHQISKVIGEAILLSSIQASLGSVEMSSKFSINSFAKNQETLDSAASALASYFIVALFWAIGSILILYSQHGVCGLLSGFIANFLMISWIMVTYWRSFRLAANKNNLKMPTLFSFN